MVIAQLSELGFDSFVQTDDGLQAYTQEELNPEEILNQTTLAGSDANWSYEWKRIPHQNWNAQWEADFLPVFVEEYASIIAPFHDVEVKGMRVIIQPQMSFGTGHHQTTWMMTKALFELDSIPSKVLDMGAGTGVLAIVAEKLGAKDILAVDIEPWSAENVSENAERNECSKIRSICGDIDAIDEEGFGLILANINKNVLRSHMAEYYRLMQNGATLLLSGFFVSDREELVTFCSELHLTFEQALEREGWTALQFRK